MRIYRVVPSSPRDGPGSAKVVESSKDRRRGFPPSFTLTERWNMPVMGAIAAILLRDSKDSRW